MKATLSANNDWWEARDIADSSIKEGGVRSDDKDGGLVTRSLSAPYQVPHASSIVRPVPELGH